MIRVLHAIDGNCDETQLQVLGALLSRRAETGLHQAVCSIDGPMVARARHHLGRKVCRTERRLWRFMNWSPQLPHAARRAEADLAHAWGIEAASVCSARLPDLPLVLTLLDPDAARVTARWLRSFPTDATVIAGSQVIRSRLLAAGVAGERIAVIRGAVDFGAINRARTAGVRNAVVPGPGPVLLMPGPPSRSGGQLAGLWAAGIVRQVYRDLRVIVPYDSTESQRLRRFADAVRMPSLLVMPDSRLTWPELTACADVFVVPATDEVCIEPIGMAMAAGLTVVGTAVRSVAELIADRHNGLLCKRAEPRPLAARILTAIDDASLRQSTAETARRQAYEMFGARSFRDNYVQLYENVVSGRPPVENIRDTAMVA